MLVIRIGLPVYGHNDFIAAIAKGPNGQDTISPEEEVPKPSTLSSEVSTTSSAKQTDGEESESGISQVGKHTTDVSSQAENQQDSTVFAKPLKPLRKKKMCRSLSWRKDSSLVETNTISSTDSETDNPAKKPLNKLAPNMKIGNNEKVSQEKPLDMAEGSFSELDKSLIQSVNSPRKIKSAYTLTVCTSMVGNEAQNQREQLLQADTTMIGNSGSHEKKTPELPRSLTDSFDQGFETATQCAPLFVKLDQKKKSRSDDVPSSFSTPVKSLTGSSAAIPFNDSGAGARQQVFTPIGLPLKQQRRRSIYDTESRRSSLAMQVIREDHPLEHHEIQSPSDCSMSLEIQRNEKERVQLLYEIFSQRSCDTKDLHFRIDGYKFAVHEAPSNDAEDVDILQRLPHQEIHVGGPGTSNGLEGRSKYAWSHSKPIPVSDLIQSDFESDIFDQEETEEESGRLSLSHFGSNHFDLASLGAEDLMMQRNSDAMRFNSASFGKDYENESLDHLFEEKKTNPFVQEKSLPMDSVPEMLNVLKKQHGRLSSVKEHLFHCHNPKMIPCETLDVLQELERNMFFFSRYADISLNSCSNPMDKILDALLDQRAVYI
ncbi:uncharacterized protein LOC133333036 [Musca vetustissima]|uniref:uncharacterized protein LOC133333036 n=1 Tax=Musca vetustissima TaxID=27455 RepID=UPI002AB6B066|nr:uncharacterized protein LOC133333036 [Musca vetustissima]